MKDKIFYISLLFIYILVLSKDSLLYLIKAKEINLNNYKDTYYEKEYDDLSKMLDLKNTSYNIKYGRIILRKINDFYNKVDINLGYDEIKKGDIVVNELGLIGIVNKTYQNYSTVNLITNNDINISVKINEGYGILRAKNNKLVVQDLKLDKTVNEGDKVYTSGLTNIKEGILIGTVKKVLKDDLELDYEIEVEPSVNFYNLKFIGVINS